MHCLCDSYLRGLRRNQQKNLADTIAVFTITMTEPSL